MIRLHADEKIFAVVRKHWFVFVVDVFGVVLMALVPFAVLGALAVAGAFSTIPELAFVFIFGAAGWLLFAWMLFWVVWTNYFLDVLVVTDRRLIDIEQFHLFSRDVAELVLDEIEDITVDVHGIIPTLLRFGDLSIQSAGVAREFEIKSIPYPEKVKNIIFDQYYRRKHERDVSKANTRE